MQNDDLASDAVSTKVKKKCTDFYPNGFAQFFIRMAQPSLGANHLYPDAGIQHH